MSLLEKTKLIGKLAMVNIGGLCVDVEIVDYKTSYGKDRWLVKPVSGEGKIWVEAFTIKPESHA